MTNKLAGCSFCLDGAELHRFELPSDKAFAQISTRILPDGKVRSQYIDPVSCAEMLYEGMIAQYHHCPMCDRPFNLRPMTLEEAKSYWVDEYVSPPYREIHPKNSCAPGSWIFKKMCYGPGADKEYGKLWRLWPRKPTPEQSAAHPWREEEG